MDEMKKDIAEVTEENVTDGKKKKGKKAKKIIITIISLLLVAAIGFGAYFYIQNENKYNEYIETARTYARKVELACDNLEIVSARQSYSLYSAMWGTGRDESIEDSMGWNTEEAEKARELIAEISQLGYKLRNVKGIYFHENVGEIKKLAKIINDDFNQCAKVLNRSGNMFGIMTAYSENAGKVESGIRKLKLLLY